MARFATALLVICGVACSTAPPRLPVASPLYNEIVEQDAAMFAAFNAHDVNRLMSFFAADVEFYHDKDGLVTFDRLREGFGRLVSNNSDLTRRLVPGTVQVFEVPGFGAIETGSHQFCHTENGKKDCGVFQFAHVWRKRDGRWQVARVLSYGH